MRIARAPLPGWTVAGSVAEVLDTPADTGVWLRGAERGGEQAALTLIRAAAARGGPWICEGLGPQGMAASLAVGAAGVAIDDADQDATREELTVRLSEIRRHCILRGDPLGCGRPLVQGPMANIAERTGLARAVSDTGAMPFAALGALHPDQARDVLSDFATALAGRPWGVGLIGFEVMPHRDAHIDAIRGLGDRGPSAVIIAGGSSGLALEVQQAGPPVWLHTPSGFLARQALERGVRAVVLEGREAGGHVGRKTSTQLWEEGLRAALDVAGPRLVILAGGISDPVTAAFAAAMAARAARDGVTVLLQAGTAFLATHEVVESGQLTSTAQQALLGASETVLVGETVNLPLRCAPNRFTREARAQELRWRAEDLPLAERRARIEAFNLGRTRIAAKGIERDGGPGRYRAVPVRRMRAEGAFTFGESAVLVDEISTVAQVVEGLTDGAAALLDGASADTSLGVTGSPRSRRIHDRSEVRLGEVRADPQAAIAIVGLGCVLPGAPGVGAFWNNLLAGVDAVRPIPPERWRTDRYFDPHAGHNDAARSASRAAGVVGELAFDPLRYRIPPRLLSTVDPVQRMALLAADQATRDAGWDRPGFDRSRAAVIIGNSMGGEHAKGLALRVRFRDVLAALEAEGALDGLHLDARRALTDRVEDRLAQTLPPIEAESMAGLLANVVAGRVASWLDWMGGNLTVDAACAASLASVAVAVDWLRSGRCDAVLAGGADADLSPETFVGFTKTHALSPEGSSPFSQLADGFTMGEGAAILALRRLDDARALGEPVYAVIRGVGQSSDGRARGITAPRPAGQKLAIERAWSQAGEDLAHCALIEAHGTGTAIGDATEVAVWKDLLRGGESRPWLGTVKASIGHLKGAAGAAGLLKTTLALATRTVPPTLHAGPLLSSLGEPDAPVRLPRAASALPERARAGVSAFGFGGTNYHVVLEVAPDDCAPPPRLEELGRQAQAARAPDREAEWRAGAHAPLLLAFGADSRAALIDAVRDDRPSFPRLAASSPWRCVVLADPMARREAVDRAARWLVDAPPGSALGREGFLSQGAPEPVVVLVPGQGAQQPGQARALRWLPDAHRDGLVDAPASDPLSLHLSQVPLAVAWQALLSDAGLPVAAALGHSLGEIGALVVAGQIDGAAALRIADARGRALAAVPPGGMLALRMEATEARAVATRHGLELAAINGPAACVIAGPADAVDAAEQALRSEGIAVRRLNVARAFHTEATASAALLLASALEQEAFASGAPVFSAASALPMVDPAADLVRAVRSPVRFADALREVLDHGHRTFVELGPGQTLSGLVRAIEPRATAIPLDPDPGDDGRGLAAAAAQLLALGHPGLVSRIPATRLRVALAATAAASATSPAPTPRPPDQRNAAPAAVDDVRAAVIDAVCEVTGYPPDFIEGDAELEAELGVDSIRKLEILGRLEDRYGFRASEADYGVLERADVDRLVAFVEDRFRSAPDPVASASRVGFWAPLQAPGTQETVSREPSTPGLTVNGDRWILTAHGSRLTAGEQVRHAVGELLSAVRDLEHPAGIEIVADPSSVGSMAALGFVRSLAREWDVPLTVAGGGPSPLVPFAPTGTPATGPRILCTGGLAGILGPILEGLADLQPQIVLLGRTGPDDAGPRADAHRRARAAIAARGLTVDHVRCDLSDPDEVAAVLPAVLARHGAPDLVIHAAGALSDGPVEAIDDAAIDRVLGPKTDAVAHLQAHLPPTSRWLVLSSITARTGNRHQALYGAANQALHGWGLSGCVVDLGPWSGRGMAADPTLLRLLESRGVQPILPADGARALRQLVGAVLVDQAPPSLVLLGSPPPDAHVLPWPLCARSSATREPLRLVVQLDPDTPALRDHRIAGRPVVPAAVWVHALHAAATHDPSAALAIEDFRVLAPTFVDRVRADLSLELAGEAPRSAAIRTDHATVATARLRSAAAPAADAPPVPPTARLADPYGEGPLFHGPAWQLLEQVRLGPHTATAVLAPSALPAVASWVDAAHQLLGLWAHAQAGWLGLPVSADRWWIAASPPPGPYRIHLSAEVSGTRAIADLAVVAESGRPVLLGEGVTLQRAGAAEPADV